MEGRYTGTVISILLTLGIVVMGYLSVQITAVRAGNAIMDAKLDVISLKLERNTTVLRQRGLMK